MYENLPNVLRLDTPLTGDYLVIPEGVNTVIATAAITVKAITATRYSGRRIEFSTEGAGSFIVTALAGAVPAADQIKGVSGTTTNFELTSILNTDNVTQQWHITTTAGPGADGGLVTVAVATPITGDGTIGNPITVANMGGATGIANGFKGAVPAPLAGEEASFLRGDGTWATAGGGSLAPGTVTNNTLRWDGAAWVETANIRVATGTTPGQINVDTIQTEIAQSGTAPMYISHSGSAQIEISHGGSGPLSFGHSGGSGATEIANTGGSGALNVGNTGGSGATHIAASNSGPLDLTKSGGAAALTVENSTSGNLVIQQTGTGTLGVTANKAITVASTGGAVAGDAAVYVSAVDASGDTVSPTVDLTAGNGSETNSLTLNPNVTLALHSLKVGTVQAGRTPVAGEMALNAAGQLVTYNGGTEWPLDASGGARVNVVTLGADTTLTLVGAVGAQNYVIADSGAGIRTITLPSGAVSGQSYKIKRFGVANVVVVDTQGAELIDGLASATLAADLQSIEVVSNGTDWFIF